MIPPECLHLYFTILSFMFGACIGSFLNVCIYRIPLDQSVVSPPSHCFSCSKPVAWFDNIPLLSYLVLRGRCRHCKTSYSARYFFVELLTGVLFLLVWFKFSGNADQVIYDPRIAVYWLFIAGLVLGTFVDFDHLYLPDRVTKGGMIIGVAVSLLVPTLHGAAGPLQSGMRSLVGLAVGFGTLYVVVEIGKLLLGRQRVALPEPTNFSIEQEDEEAVLVIDDDRLPWSEMFPRESDRWILEPTEMIRDEKSIAESTIVLTFTGVTIGDHVLEPNDAAGLSGELTAYTYPREAMGFGDVKLLGAIGAFLGWKAVFFTILFSSLVGSVVGVSLIVFGGKEWQSRIPFGPYLALSAVVWILWGQVWWNWYVSFLTAAPV